MVDIAPFKAVRFNKVERVADVLAPPYDVIDPKMQDALYAKSPNNIVRIDLAKTEPGDGEDTKYTRAQQTLETWLKSGVLAEDATAAFYVLAQTFTGPDGVRRTRTGFFSRAKLTTWDEGPILPHERTLRGPKIDRLKLMRSTHFNLSPIFGTYRDADGRILAALEKAKSKSPVAEAVMDGVENKLWRLDAPAEVQQIQAALSPAKLYIADGHHRYETGIAYRDERRGAAPGNKTAGYESILMFASAVEDPGMVIFPTHRLVFGLPELDGTKLCAKLAPFFDREDVSEDPREGARALEAAGQRGNAFLVCAQIEGGGVGRQILVAKKDAPWSTLAELPQNSSLKGLDVAVLHAAFLEHALGISPEAQATQTNLRYSKDWTSAWNSVGKDGVQAAFLMNPTKIEEVLRVADEGQVMPQKSTFFYPKIPSGLVLYGLD